MVRILHKPTPMIVIVRIPNSWRVRPSEASSIGSRLRDIIGKPLTVRVSPRWIELAVYGASSENVRRVLEDHGYKVLEVYHVPLFHGSGSEPLWVLARRYLAMMRGHRFWEAHSVGEELWHRVGDKGRVLAVIAGAFAKAQEGYKNSALSILEKARKLARDTSVEGLVDWACILGSLNKIYEGSESSPEKCVTRLIEHILSQHKP